MSATLATLFTSPADCVKTRMQVNPDLHPTLRKAIQRIYSVRPAAGMKLRAALITGPRFRGFLLRVNITNITQSNERSNRVVGIRGFVDLFPGSTMRLKAWLLACKTRFSCHVPLNKCIFTHLAWLIVVHGCTTVQTLCMTRLVFKSNFSRAG
jgi:hypothetical protein